MVKAMNRLQDWDEWLLLKINLLCRSKAIKNTFCSITKLGDGWFFAVIVFSLLALDFSKYLTLALSTTLTFIIELPIYWQLKNRIKRNRPPQKILGFKSEIFPPDKFSFPSGHTCSSFLVWAQLNLFAPTLAPYMLVIACLVGLSRVILGVHFLGDVVAGACLGTAFSYAVALTFFI